MERYLGRFAPVAYALLRIITGLMLACHGGAHTFGMFTPGMKAPSLGSLLGVAGLIELVGGFLVAFGLFGGWAAFLCSGTMAVAYFMAHAPKGFFPIVNHGEPAVLYCFILLLIACRGSGILSIDQLISRQPLSERP
jgi:putative oxidoreductase